MTVVWMHGKLGGYSRRFLPDEDSIEEETIADICNECCEVMLDQMFHALLKTSLFLQQREPLYFAPYTDIFTQWLKEYQHFATHINPSFAAILLQYHKPRSGFSCCGLFQQKKPQQSLTNQFISHIVHTHMRLDTESVKKIQAIATIKDNDEELVYSQKQKISCARNMK